MGEELAEKAQEFAKLYQEMYQLTREMRNVNVRSYGLKVTTHESWCHRMERMCQQFGALLKIE